jgi:hypothetical protein
MPRCVPIPAEVRRHFATFDTTRDARPKRLDTAPRGKYVSGRTYLRFWIVEIWRNGDGERSKIIADGASPAGILETAVRSAERRFGLW